MKIKKRNLIVLVVLAGIILLSVLFVVGIFNKNKDIPIAYMSGSFTIDVNNPEAVVGASDYVFVGKVIKNTGTTYASKDELERADGATYYVDGEPYTHYEVQVLDNIKNELITTESIKIMKQGGLLSDGSAYELFNDDILPKEGDVYIFNVNVNDDGVLVVSGPNSNIPFNEKSNKLKTETQIEKTEEYKEYESAYENQKEENVLGIEHKDDLDTKYDTTKED
jgi:hypothetical protein